AACLRILSSIRVERCIVGVIGERLMMKLEERVGVTAQSVGPASRIPSPADAGGIEPIADSRSISGIRLAIGQEWMIVIDGVEQLIGWSAGGIRRLQTKSGIHVILAVNSQVVVLQGFGHRVPAGLEAGRNGLVPLGGRGGNQPLVIEEGAAVGRVE